MDPVALVIGIVALIGGLGTLEAMKTDTHKYPEFKKSNESYYTFEVEEKHTECPENHCVGIVDTVDGHRLTIKLTNDEKVDIFKKLEEGKEKTCVIRENATIKECNE